MAFLDVGDGKTYSTIPNAIAAIPATITEDYIVRVYPLTGGYAYTANITIASINNTNGTYAIIIRGMSGSITAGGQLEVSFSSAAESGFNVTVNYGVVIENLKVTSTVGRCLSGLGVMIGANDCYVETSGNNITSYQGYHKNCIIINSATSNDATSQPFGLIGCLVKANRVAAFTMLTSGSVISDSVLYGGTVGLSGPGQRVLNSIIVGATNAVTANASNLWQVSNVSCNSIFYSEANPTEIATGVTSIGYLFRQNCNSIIADPILKKTGGILEWLTPTGLSKALPVNQTLVANGIYASKKRTPVFIGAYTDYVAPDFPAVTNVLTTDTVDGVQGRWQIANFANYKQGEKYGVDGTSLTGTYAAGVEAGTPSLTAVSVGDGSITVTVTAAVETDRVYMRVRRNSPVYQWTDRNITFSRIGSGTITTTGLQNGIEYEVACQAIGTSGYSDFGGSRFAIPDSDQYAGKRNTEKLRLRDQTAKSYLYICQTKGSKVVFENEGDADATLYAMVDTGQTLVVGVRTGAIGASSAVISIPRQTNFPPTAFYPNCRITLADKIYQVDSVEHTLEDINFTPVFVMNCSVLGCGTEY